MSFSIFEQVGKIILIKLTDDFLRNAKIFIQPGQSDVKLFYARLSAVDQFGVWIANNNWKTKPIKESQMQTHKAMILIPWHSIESLAAFPERVFDSPSINSIKESGIGFLAEIQ